MGGNNVVSIGKGNPRKPTALKEQEGTARPDRANPNEPRPDPIALPKPPATLSDRQAQAWRAFAKVVNPLRIMTPSDLHAFEVLVKSWTICVLAEESLQKPLVLKDEKPRDRRARKPAKVDPGPLLYVEWGIHGARIKPRPELSIIATHSKILLYQFSRFGLTPADRSRVSELESTESRGASKGIGEFE